MEKNCNQRHLLGIICQSSCGSHVIVYLLTGSTSLSKRENLGDLFLFNHQSGTIRICVMTYIPFMSDKNVGDCVPFPVDLYAL